MATLGFRSSPFLNCNCLNAESNGIHKFLEIPPGQFPPSHLMASGGRCARRMSITMRDRGKNRKPLQKGRNVSIEAIQTVQALKRAKMSENGGRIRSPMLEQVFDSKFRRLLKFDMIAVLQELLRQNECVLALKVFEEVQREYWYKPQPSLYTEIISVLGSNGLWGDVKLLLTNLKMEKNLEPNTKAFNDLIESLMRHNMTKQAMDCFYLMKSLQCDLDKQTFRILISGLESNGERDLSAIVRQEGEKFYGMYPDFLEDNELKSTPDNK